MNLLCASKFSYKIQYHFFRGEKVEMQKNLHSIFRKINFTKCSENHQKRRFYQVCFKSIIIPEKQGFASCSFEIFYIFTLIPHEIWIFP